MIHHYNHETLVVLVLFTVPFYHFLLLRYLELAKPHFSSDILVPFQNSGVLYSRVNTACCNIVSFLFSLPHLSSYKKLFYITEIQEAIIVIRHMLSLMYSIQLN